MFSDIDKTQFNAVMTVLAAVADQQKPKEEKKLLKIKAACEIAQVSRWTIRRWLKAGYINGIKLGESRNSPVRIYAESLYAYMASREIKAKETRKEVK